MKTLSKRTRAARKDMREEHKVSKLVHCKNLPSSLWTLIMILTNVFVFFLSNFTAKSIKRKKDFHLQDTWWTVRELHNVVLHLGEITVLNLSATISLPGDLKLIRSLK